MGAEDETRIRSFFLLSTCVRVKKQTAQIHRMALRLRMCVRRCFLHVLPMDDAGMRPEWLRNVGIWEKKRPGAPRDGLETKSMLGRVAKGAGENCSISKQVERLLIDTLIA